LARGANAVRGVAAPPARSSAVAISDRLWSPTTIEAEDFRAGNWRENEWSNVAYVKCDEVTHYKLTEGAPITLWVRARLIVAGSGSGLKLVSLPGLLDGSLGPANVEVLIWHKDATTNTWNAGSGQAVSYAASGIGGEVEYIEPANTAQTEIYYIHGDGLFRFRALRALGGFDDANVMLWNDSFSAMHQVNQRSSRTTPRWNRNFDLVPGMTLSFEVKTSVPVVFNARARHILAIPAMSSDLEVRNKIALNAAVEIATRGGI
jgi:hypothetical protein